MPNNSLTNPHAHDHGGKPCYFCSDYCLAKFKGDPASFIGGKAGNESPLAGTPVQGRIYTCPMHPEVRQEGPGTCPKCGMALEPLNPEPIGRTEYTCPMHPDVVRDGPGVCPKCGMTLEPRSVSLDGEEENGEYREMRKRFIVGAVLSVPRSRAI